MSTHKIAQLIEKVRSQNNPQLTLSVIMQLIKALYELINIFEIQAMELQKKSTNQRNTK